MFELGRQLLRLFARGPSALSDAVRLEELDREALAREAERLAGEAVRGGARRSGSRSLAAAAAWRELARRTGDPEALRRASAEAARAQERFAAARRPRDEALAWVELAQCALARLEAFDDAAMASAAEAAAGEGAREGGAAGALAAATAARLRAREALIAGEATLADAAASAFDAPILRLEALGGRDEGARLAAARTRLARAELLRRMGARLKDELLVRAAYRDLSAAEQRLEGAPAPLTAAFVPIARAACQATLAELVGDLTRLARAIGAIGRALEQLSRDRSPADWAAGQALLAGALAALGEANENPTALRRALTACDRAASALEASPSHLVRAEAIGTRGRVLARLIELTGDGRLLEAAEQGLKAELRALPRPIEPVAWGLLQMQLGQVYAARLLLRRRDRGVRARAALAFQAALDVFEEGGLAVLSGLAAGALQKLSRTPVG